MTKGNKQIRQMLQSMTSVSNGSNFIEAYQTEDEYKNSTDEPSDVERLSENLIESAKTSEENLSEPFDNDQIQPSNIEADNELFTGIRERGIEETTDIQKVLESEGFIRGYTRVEHDNNKSDLEIELKYFDGSPVIEEIHRESRPGLRQYSGKDDLPVVRGGLGIAIVSTNKGVMTDKQARQEGVGGEVLCTVF